MTAATKPLTETMLSTSSSSSSSSPAASTPDNHKSDEKMVHSNDEMTAMPLYIDDDIASNSQQQQRNFNDTSRYNTTTDSSTVDGDIEGEHRHKAVTQLSTPPRPFIEHLLISPLLPTTSENDRILDIISSDIDSTTVQARLKAAVETMTAKYITRYSTLAQAFENLEKIRSNLEHDLVIQQAHYDKAVREMRFYKSKYQQLRQVQYHQNQQHHEPLSRTFIDDDDIVDWQRRVTTAGNNKSSRAPRRNKSFASENNESCCGSTCSSSRSVWTCSSARSSVNTFSFIPHGTFHPHYNLNEHSSAGPAVYENDNGDSAHQQLQQLDEQVVDLMAVLDTEGQPETIRSSTKCLPIETVGAGPSAPPPTDPPPPPPPPSYAVPACPSSPEGVQQDLSSENDSASEPSSDPLKNTRTMPLTFACGDGFWDTIARGKNNKTEVDSLISNYLRRGGQPNVAKNSSTLKSVKEGYGLIHALIAVKNSRALSRVVEAGANPNVVSLSPEESDRITPLVLASQLGYLTGVRLLIERARADILQRGPGQITALHAAIEKGADDIVIYLLRVSNYALLDVADVEGATPLHYACKHGRTRIMVMFIRDCHVKLDPRDNKGETPLHYAVRQRRLKIITRLIGDFGVYPNHYVVKQTPTPLDLAKSGGFKTISEYLRKMGAKTTKEMEKTANRSSITNSTKESSSTTSATTSRNSDATTSTTFSSQMSGITAMGLSSTISRGSTATTTTSSSRSVLSSSSGSASILSSNESAISRDGASFVLSRSSLSGFRNNLLSHS